MARRACIKHASMIDDVGDADYALVRPFLVKIQNPKQLWQIEQNSPQIVGLDAEIWRDFCKRDIPNYEKDPVEPSNPMSWYKVYLKLQKESQKQVDKDAEQLKATLDSIKNKQAQNTAKQVELRGVKLAPGMVNHGPQIQLPRNSSFFHKERPKHLDNGILQYERDNGGVPSDRQHQRETRRKAPEPVSKTSKLIAKFKKDTLANGRFAMQQRPGIVPARDMRVKPTPTKASMLAAPQANRVSALAAQSFTKEPVSPQSLPSITNKKRKIDDAELDAAPGSATEMREKRVKALQGASYNTTTTPQASTSTTTIAATTTSPHSLSPPPSRPASTKLTTPLPTAKSRSGTPQGDRPIMRIRARGAANPLMMPARARPRRVES